MGMSERTRYRISGSIFLLALAVIFLPMLFDGRTPAKPEIPARPAADMPEPLPEYDEVVPATDTYERVTELQQQVDDEGFTTATGERFGEPVLLPVSEASEVYAVQAASFSNLENARNLREALRAQGLEAFISSARLTEGDTPGDPMHRVAVGPLLAMNDARDIAERIKRDYELDAQIVEMQP